MKVRYEHLLAILITGMIIALAYSTKSGKALLAVGIFVVGFLLTYILTWYYNSRVQKVEDERTEIIHAKSARNGYAVMSFLLFLEYLWEYTSGNSEMATKLIIPLAIGALMLLVSHYYYEQVM
ncbi:DUF2178 domain-containing protein [Thermococcus argininiproducens]|uniref:DUF2178 domain-containing protein n=1 Tax=Thermococcus argininiproducens TaxID=2866384 RepID=A0A9E7SD82_9EURY|nr:DUF2178 domain-containing protein [Thermococcus argininiproducens]USG99817.1 DUF2178 domain-containing protein [Thermococcus argininiproducens]